MQSQDVDDALAANDDNALKALRALKDKPPPAPAPVAPPIHLSDLDYHEPISVEVCLSAILWVCHFARPRERTIGPSVVNTNAERMALRPVVRTAAHADLPRGGACMGGCLCGDLEPNCLRPWGLGGIFQKKKKKKGGGPNYVLSNAQNLMPNETETI